VRTLGHTEPIASCTLPGRALHRGCERAGPHRNQLRSCHCIGGHCSSDSIVREQEPSCFLHIFRDIAAGDSSLQCIPCVTCWIHFDARRWPRYIGYAANRGVVLTASDIKVTVVCLSSGGLRRELLTVPTISVNVGVAGLTPQERFLVSAHVYSKSALVLGWGVHSQCQT
jgi:hypothetical protein